MSEFDDMNHEMLVHNLDNLRVLIDQVQRALSEQEKEQRQRTADAYADEDWKLF